MLDPGDCTNQSWQVLLYDTPDCLEVNLEVVMHKHVTKVGYSTPRYFRLGCLEAIT